VAILAVEAAFAVVVILDVAAAQQQADNSRWATVLIH